MDEKLQQHKTARDAAEQVLRISILTGKEGGTITYECTVFVSGSRKIFCRKKCGKKDILVQTTGDRAQRGRYSIKSKKATIVSPSVMYVSIANLTKSDSGLYRCRVDNHLFPDEEFEIRVEDGEFETHLRLTSLSHQLPRHSRKMAYEEQDKATSLCTLALFLAVISEERRRRRPSTSGSRPRGKISRLRRTQNPIRSAGTYTCRSNATFSRIIYVV
uniref:Immunoglobulin domain-containing protein n=1 Tax=Sparus aurata TaxID=8175 RepID=A0A671U4F6_SPAAU